MMAKKVKEPVMSRYPKSALSISQIKDEKNLEKYRREKKIKQRCRACGHRKFFIDTLGIEHCSSCYAATGTIIL
jgi:ribosomal protein S14